MSLRSAVLPLLIVQVGLAGAQGRQLEPGNSLKITCAQVPSMCVIRTIDGSGIVSLPGLGNVVAVDMDIERFRTRLASMLSAKLGRKIRVTVEPYAMANDPVGVEGDVEKPISRSYNPRLTVMDMIRDASLLKDADDGHVRVLHENGRSVDVDLGAGDVAVQPGDIIEVEPLDAASLVTVVGPVLKPGGMRCTPGLTLAGAIRNAGGLEGHAEPTHIVLVRPGEKDRVLNLKDDDDFPLRRGDAIAVGLTKVRQWVSVSGPVPHPGLVEFKPGMRLTEAIHETGANFAKLPDAVTLIHIRARDMRTIHLHLARILSKMDLDPALQASDSIVLGGR